MILLDFYYISRSDILPLNALKTLLLSIGNLNKTFIFLSVWHFSLTVFDQIFCSTHSNHNNQRQKYAWLTTRYTDWFNYLKRQNYEEVKISYLSKLDEQIFWDEVPPGIFASFDPIILIFNVIFNFGIFKTFTSPFLVRIYFSYGIYFQRVGF